MQHGTYKRLLTAYDYRIVAGMQAKSKAEHQQICKRRGCKQDDRKAKVRRDCGPLAGLKSGGDLKDKGDQ